MGMKISVITVCFNAEEEIASTIKSVLNQTYEEYEYVIVDGKSVDRTMAIINEIANDYMKHKKNIKIISEKDTGIYNAMNKGIKHAKGDWIIFLNAGDTFFNNTVLDNVSNLILPNTDAIYGDTYYIEKKERFLVKGRKISEVKKSMPFCHQSFLCKKSIIQELLFNEKYRICADYDLICRIYLKDYTFQYEEIIFSNYKLGGFSQRNQKLCIKESIDIRKQYGFINNEQLWYLKYIIYISVNGIIKKIIPKILKENIRKQLYRR